MEPVAIPATARRRRKAERPAELLAAALEEFASRGYAAARLDDIARRAGVSKGTVFLYYRNKQALFRAVIETAVLPHLAAGEALVAKEDAEPEPLMRALFAGYWRVLGDPQLSGIPKLVMAEAGNFPEIAAYYHEQVVMRGRALFAEIYRRGVARGVFREADPALMCQLALSPLLFVCVWRSSLGGCEAGGVDPDRFVAEHVDMFLRGLMQGTPERSSS
jgi:AcrR family transcriptional regulator